MIPYSNTFKGKTSKKTNFIVLCFGLGKKLILLRVRQDVHVWALKRKLTVMSAQSKQITKRNEKKRNTCENQRNNTNDLRKGRF